MKNIYLYKNAALYHLLLLLLLLTACKKEEHTLVVTAKSTLLQYVSKDPQLTLFKAALERAGMLNDTTFSNGGPYTIFAPVDSAFKVAGLTLDRINAYDPKALAFILQYHFVYGNLSSNSLIGFYTQVAISRNPVYRPTITKNYFGIFLNGIPLTTANIILGDGIVHKLGRVAFPPVGNMEDVIQQSPDLTLFTAATHLLGYDTIFVKANPLPGYHGLYVSLTVLAPNDAAFGAYGFADVNAIKQADPVVLRSFIQFYFKPGTSLTSSFLGGTILGDALFDLVNPRIYKIQADGITFTTSGNVVPPHIVRPDVIATNGVVQVVDQVIIP
ncbi:putative surface protein with fasciclin (FAS1) repeats [Chitinophaga niastensis]|uniref:Putative surface protein with fasciclin (FAS1) repeats n=1 Tax=Chitinophaga niastensis TaxID=536980 RepID=A0A2P8HP30_CHINA|nr:fasciclin domain-containing protein [Chitinophaga niastensis]PSL47971.1 putative surface protein with fasciclin (FAS1) repeats [Chitinophaga niastensis]